eukprot:g48091.t1
MGFIKGEMTSDSLRLASYSASQLDACLNNSVLIANLTQLGQIAFSREQLLVLKGKLGENDVSIVLDWEHGQTDQEFCKTLAMESTSAFGEKEDRIEAWCIDTEVSFGELLFPLVLDSPRRGNPLSIYSVKPLKNP